MRELSDEEIQALLDAGKPEAMPDGNHSEDFQLYQNLYQSLAEDDTEIPHRFASKVSTELYYQKERKAALAHRIITGALAIGLFALAFVALRVFGFSTNFMPEFLLQNKAFLFVGAMALLVIAATTVESLLQKKSLASVDL